MRWITLTVCGLLVTALPLWGGEPGSAGAAFLKLGVDGRAIGMGEAHTGLTGNVNAMYWNPAGLAAITSAQLAFMHNFHFLDMRHDYLGLGLPFGTSGSIGIAAYYWTSGTIMGCDEYGMPTEEFSAWDLGIGLSYAHSVSPYVSAGATLKAILEKNEEEGGSALAMDAGALLKPPVAGLSVGMAVKNLGTKLKLVEESYPLPLTVRLGAAWQVPVTGLALAADLAVANDDGPSVSAGVEYTIARMLALRLGYRTGSDLGALAGLRAGCGFRFEMIGLDYAFAPYGDLGNSHRISLLLTI